jgi:hypothetical protein
MRRSMDIGRLDPVEYFGGRMHARLIGMFREPMERMVEMMGVKKAGG